MNYFKFLIKKIIKDKLTISMILIMLITVFFVFVQNVRTKPSVSLENTVSSDMNTVKKTITGNKKIINSSKSSLADVKSAKIDLKSAKLQFKEDQTLLKAKRNNKIDELYRILTKQNKVMLASFKNTDSGDKETMTAIKKEGIRLKAFKKARINYEPESYPTKSFSFTTELFKYIIPILFVLISLFLLVQNFSKTFYNKLDKSKLLPGSSVINATTEIKAGFSALSILLVITVAASFLIAGIASGFDSPNFPIFEYGANNSMVYVPIWIVLLKSVILFWLCLSNITIITYFLVSLLRNKMGALLVSILVILGTEILTTIVEPLQAVANLLPTTYLYSLSVVSGESRVSYNNSLITFDNGILLMIVVVIIFSFLTVLIRKKDIFLKI
ncbi:hypothetical protein ACVPPR_01625 [Dellaglioa sp. L3N]